LPLSVALEVWEVLEAWVALVVLVVSEEASPTWLPVVVLVALEVSAAWTLT
jgi:hypothetical protein